MRGEKVPANPIPERRYDQFKYKLEEYSERFAERNMMLFYLGVGTGYRMQDLVELTIGKLIEALDEEQLCIQEQKQKKEYDKHIQDNPKSKRKAPKERKVIIKPNLRKLIKVYVKGKDKSSYAFLSNKGDSFITSKSYSDILSDVGKSLGLKNISGHSLRKTYATRIWEETRDIEKVRKALGHTRLETTKDYLGMESEVREEASSITDRKL
ncbi:tyrosine-type recombinase/integrase [Clostridium sp.]|uniref:tyrosine-type recombinase/integrase n=1 Tax=Clostridium sp. TaxID=1506 RepID=UPI0039952E5C